jgi:lysophospholipase L1-like esterase
MTRENAPEAHNVARPRRRVVLAFLLVNACLLALIAEGGARAWSAYRERRDRAIAAAPSKGPSLSPAEAEAAGRALGLDVYEMADPVRRGSWRLRPGYRGTLREVLEAKRAAGRVLAVRHMEAAAGRLGIRPDELAVEVNGDGFRGPALDPAHRQYRILVLGDSCTFGSPVSERFPYARAMERELHQSGLTVEVVNGGVEGYSPADVVARLDELCQLRPEMTTVSIGWNALYRESYLQDATGIRRYLHSARLLQRASAAAWARLGDRRQVAMEAYERRKRPDSAATELALLEGYVPSFLPDVVRIVESMQAAGSRIVILTLPGLYSTDEAPSPRALEIGHLPTFTDNPFVLARMAERYNDVLRALARDRGLDLVDLDRWSRVTLRPPEEHFIDSVHLDELAQEQAGISIARAIGPLLPDSARSSLPPAGTAPRP